MNFSDIYKVQWFLPKRNGTRTTIEILKKLEFEIKGHSCDTNEVRKGYYTILNVRNPYSRVVSLYYLYCYHNQNFEVEFDNFIELINLSQRSNFIFSKTGQRLKRNIDFYNIHYDFFIEETLGRSPEKIVKLENFENDLKSIPFLKNHGDLIDNFVVINGYENEFSKMTNKKFWKDFYNENNSIIIYEKLKEQFLKYGYDKNSWKNVTSQSTR